MEAFALVLLCIIVMFFVFAYGALFFASLFHKDITRQEAADIIDCFANHKQLPSAEWDDFTSIKHKDSLIEQVASECVMIRDKFPPSAEGGYCNEKGFARMRELRDMLLTGEYITGTKDDLPKDEPSQLDN